MQVLLGGPLIAPLVALADPERAETAAIDADVRRIEPVFVREIRLVAVQLLANVVGEAPDLDDVVRLEELEPVLEGEPLFRIDLLADLRQISRYTCPKH